MIQSIERWTCDKCLAKTEIRQSGDDIPPNWARVWAGSGSLMTKALAHLCPNCVRALKAWLQPPDPEPLL